MSKIEMKVTKDETGIEYGKVEFDGNELSTYGANEEILKKKMKAMLSVFHDLDPDSFDIDVINQITD